VRVALIGVGVAGYQAAYFAAVHECGIAVATLIALGLGPVLAATGEALAARRMHSATVLGALVMSLAGLGVLVVGADEGAAEGSVALGAALATLSGAGYAATVLMSRGLVGRVSALDLNTWSAIAAAVVLLPVVFTGLAGPGDVQGAVGILWLGLVASALAYGLYFAALNTISATSATMLALLEPVTATVLAAALFGEHLTLLALAGGALVLGAVLLLYREGV
jgi:DME family drug/metabolite transporter